MSCGLPTISFCVPLLSLSSIGLIPDKASFSVKCNLIVLLFTIDTKYVSFDTSVDVFVPIPVPFCEL